MRAATAITRVELLRFLRDRSNLFFVFVFPLLLVVFIGAQFGGQVGTPVGVVAGADPAAERLVADLDDVDALAVERFDDRDELVAAVSRGNLAAGVLVPADYGAALGDGVVRPVEFIGRADGRSQAIGSVVAAVAGERAATVDAARGAAGLADAGGDLAELLELADGLAAVIPQVAVTTRAIGDGGLEEEFAELGQFDLGASSQLFLFVFLTTLASSAAIIQARQFGVATRMRATPTSVPAILVGLAGGRFLVALLQAGYIVVTTWLLFDVDWGDPLATGVLVTLFCLVAAGAAVIVGSVFRNDSQAGGAAIGLGLVLAALGGSMVPLEVFPDAARRIAFLTPHGWANTAIAEVVRRDGGLLDVATELAVLGGFALVTLALGTVLLRRALARPLD